MNEEIKENNSMFECCICNNYKTGEFIVIDDKKYHLNCITNLQQKYDISLQDNVRESHLRMELQQENKRLNNCWKRINVIIRNDKTLMINDNALSYIKQLENYKSRNEKVIEDMQKLIDDINNKTIIGLNNFITKLEVIQYALAQGSERK